MPFSPFRGIVFTMLDKNMVSILDIGCREGGAVENINLRGWQIWRVGVDLDLESLRHCKEISAYDEVVLCDALRLPLRSKSLDGIFCIEFIEHLAKSDGITFLEDLERVAKRQIIITTPVGYMKEPSSCSTLMQHRSGWRPEELRARGYKVRGMIGPRFLPMNVAYWISHILCFTYLWPEFSHAMICAKHPDAVSPHWLTKQGVLLTESMALGSPKRARH